jgi:hypothetical protein
MCFTVISDFKFFNMFTTRMGDILLILKIVCHGDEINWAAALVNLLGGLRSKGYRYVSIEQPHCVPFADLTL